MPDLALGGLAPLTSLDHSLTSSSLAALPGSISRRRAAPRPLGLGLTHLPDLPQRSGSWATLEASLPPISPVPGLTPSGSSTPSTSSSTLSNPFGYGPDPLASFSPARTRQHNPLRRKASCDSLSDYGRIGDAGHLRQRSGSSVGDDWSSSISRKRSDIGLPWSSSSLSSSSRSGHMDDSFLLQPLSSSQKSLDMFPSTDSNPKFSALSSARLADRTPWSSGPLARSTRDPLAMPSGISDTLPRLDLPTRAPSPRLGHASSYAYGMGTSMGGHRSGSSRRNDFGDPFSKSSLGSYDSLGGLPPLPPLGMSNIGTPRRPLGKNASVGSLSRYEGSGW